MFHARPYQLEAKGAVWSALKDHTSTLVVIPTGGGKSVLFSMLADEWMGPVLILAHRKELLDQAKAKLEVQCREPVGIDRGQERARPWGTRMLGAERIVCGSVPTLCKENRRRIYDPSFDWLVVVDEAHHATAATYKVILDHFLVNPRSRVVGVTATPKRTDGTGMIDAFKSAAYVYPVQRAIKEGWLVDVETLRPQIEGLDFSSCRTRSGDLSPEDITRIATQERPLHEVAGVLRREAGGRQGIVFCASVPHVHSMTAMLQRPAYFGEDRVAGADGSTDEEVRAGLIERFRSGSLQVLVNCGLFTEGLDVPNASWLGMCRPTKSLVVYTQALGRIMRPLPGLVDTPGMSVAERLASIAGSSKPRGTLLDFCGVAGKHKLVDVVDVLHGDKDDESKEQVRRVIRESRDAATFDQAAHKAALEEALLREQIEWRKRAGVTAQVTYRIESLGTLTGNEVSAASASPGRPAEDRVGTRVKPAGFVPPSEGQVRHLIWLGVSEETARGYSLKQAATVIDSLRRKRGLPVSASRTSRAALDGRMA